MPDNSKYLKALDALKAATGRLLPMAKQVDNAAGYFKVWLERFASHPAKPVPSALVGGTNSSMSRVAVQLPTRHELLAAVDEWLVAHEEVDKAWHAIKSDPPPGTLHPDTVQM